MSWVGPFVPSRALALFASTSPPLPSSFGRLASRHIARRALPSSGDGYAIELSRPGWGRARVSTPSGRLPDLVRTFEHDTRLSTDEADELALARSHLEVELIEGSGDPLADRKALFRFADAVLGDDDPGLVDPAAQRFWSMEALDDELCHDARLDAFSLMTSHAISDGAGRVLWLHSHGLSDTGRFDFDIVRPLTHVLMDPTGVQRGLAFAILEGRLGPRGPALALLDEGEISTMPVAEFLARGGDPDVDLGGAGHDGERSVIVDVQIDTGLPLPSPAAILSFGVGDELVVNFSTDATSLMAERARATWKLVRDAVDELADHVQAPLVKLGFTDSRGRIEHLWLEVEDMDEDPPRATLVSQPRYVTSLRAGESVAMAEDQLSDWVLPSERGIITPADLSPLRRLRAQFG